MNAQLRPTLLSFLLLIMSGPVIADIGIRVAPEVSGPKPVMAANTAAQGPTQAATNATVEPNRVTMFYPPFPVESGRKRLFHVGFMVKDLDKSIDFYVTKLGFKHIRTQDSGWIKIAFISTGDGEPQIELEQLTRDMPGMPKQGFSHIGMFIDNVDAFYAASQADGVEWKAKPGRPGPGAPYMGFVVDPDGNRIEIMENPKADCTSCHRGPHLN